MIAERNGHIGYRSCPCNVTVLCTVYCVEVRHFQPGQRSVLCLRNAHTSQANRTLGIKCAWVQNGLPSVSALLDRGEKRISAILVRKLSSIIHLKLDSHKIPKTVQWYTQSKASEFSKNKVVLTTHLHLNMS